MQIYPDLVELVKAWPELPEHTKMAIKSLVKTHCLNSERQKLAEAAERENGLSHKSDIGPGDYLSDEEVRRCRAVLSDEERVIYELMLGLGLRPGEICQLQERDLRIDYGNAAIFVRYGKWTKRTKRTRDKKKSHWVYHYTVCMQCGFFIFSGDIERPFGVTRKGYFQ